MISLLTFSSVLYFEEGVQLREVLSITEQIHAL